MFCFAYVRSCSAPLMFAHVLLRLCSLMFCSAHVLITLVPRPNHEFRAFFMLGGAMDRILDRGVVCMLQSGNLRETWKSHWLLPLLCFVLVSAACTGCVTNIVLRETWENASNIRDFKMSTLFLAKVYKKWRNFNKSRTRFVANLPNFEEKKWFHTFL